jgi:trimeric autotransporter adhesin
MNIMRQSLVRYFGVLLVVLVVSAQLHAAPAVTTTELTISPGVPISEGTIVNLVATVRADAPVTQGSVYFCERISTCLVGVGSYGAAQLTSSGTATVRTRLNVGDNTVLAIFMATKKDLGSKSAARVVTVTSRVVYPSTTSLTFGGSPGNYTLSGSVSSFGKEQLAGPVSLVDSTATNLEIGSGVLSDPSIGLANAIPYSVGRLPAAVATGDFNCDGVPHHVVAKED